MAVPQPRRGERHPHAVLKDPAKRATILRLAAEDRTYRQIGKAVGVSYSTVRRFLLGITSYPRDDSGR